MSASRAASGAARSSPASVIVVSYNTREKLRRCLARIEREHEIIVVDNASHDGSPEMVEAEFPHVRLLRMSENLGFGRANNLGMEAARGRLLLLLNSDCYAEPGAIAELARVFEDERVAAAGGELRNPDGSLQESVAGELTLGRVFLEQSFLDRLPPLRAAGLGYWRTRSARADAEASGGSVSVEQVMGACLMLRPGERFDERFFLYCEDTELCRRIRRRGEIRYAPGAVFTHELGSSSRADPWRGIALYNRGKELYFAIHHGRAAASACFLLNRLGACLRLLLWGLPAALTLGRVPRFRRQARTFLRVLAAPRRGPPVPHSLANHGHREPPCESRSTAEQSPPPKPATGPTP